MKKILFVIAVEMSVYTEKYGGEIISGYNKLIDKIKQNCPGSRISTLLYNEDATVFQNNVKVGDAEYLTEESCHPSGIGCFCSGAYYALKLAESVNKPYNTLFLIIAKDYNHVGRFKSKYSHILTVNQIYNDFFKVNNGFLLIFGSGENTKWLINEKYKDDRDFALDIGTFSFDPYRETNSISEYDCRSLNIKDSMAFYYEPSSEDFEKMFDAAANAAINFNSYSEFMKFNFGLNNLAIISDKISDPLTAAFDLNYPPLPMVKLGKIFGATTAYDSKIGGDPYMAEDFEYPFYNNQPMLFLAQINFNEIPHIDKFPSCGILQFYLSDIPKNLNKNNVICRIIYHKKINFCANNLPDIHSKNNSVTQMGIRLYPKEETLCPLTIDDNRAYLTMCFQYGFASVETLEEHYEKERKKLLANDIRTNYNTCIGGYPSTYGTAPINCYCHDYLLLQLADNNSHRIIRFMINRGDLIAENFDNVKVII